MAANKRLNELTTAAALATGDLTLVGQGTNAFKATLSVFKDFMAFTVKALGAKGDGTSNDTSFFQSAADAGGAITVTPGTYLIDKITITVPCYWILQPGAILKMRTAVSGANSIFDFGAGSDGSIVEGGTFDGNRGTLGASHTNRAWAWAAFRSTAGANHIIIRDVKCQNFVNAAVSWLAGKFALFENFDIIDCGKGFVVQSSDCTLRNIRETDIGFTGHDIFQHANEFRLAEHLTIDGLKIINFNADTTGPEPRPQALVCVNCHDLNIINFVADGYTGTATDDVWVGMNIKASTGVHIRGVSIRGYVQGIDIGSCFDWEISDFLIDGEYVSTTAQVTNILARASGVYENFGPDPGTDTEATTTGGRGRLSNGSCIRGDVGLEWRIAEATLSNVYAWANVKYGFNIVPDTDPHGFVNHPVPRPSNVILDNCNAQFNGQQGVRWADGDNLRVIGGRYSNNGQDTTKAASQRAGIATEGSNTPTDLHMTDVDLSDDQSWTHTDGASFDPATTDADDQIVISLIDPNDIFIGQFIKLKGAAAGPADLTAKVVGRDSPAVAGAEKDDILVEISGGATLVEASNLTSLTGTVSSSGATLTGVSTLFTTEIVGRTWVKADGEFRQIVEVFSATSAQINTAFTAPLSADTMEKLTIDVEAIPSQQRGYHIGSVFAGQLRVSNLRQEGNVEMRQQIVTLDDIADGQVIILESGIVNVDTGDDTTVLIGSIPRDLVPLGYRFKVTTGLTGTDGTIDLRFADGAGVIYTEVTGIAIALDTKSQDPITGADVEAAAGQATYRFEMIITTGGDNVPSAGAVKADLLLMKKGLVAFS